MSATQKSSPRRGSIGRRLCAAVALATLAGLATGVLATPSALGAFSFSGFDAEIKATSAGGTYTQAGGHPYAITTHVSLPTEERNIGTGPIDFPVEAAKDILVDTPAGFIGNPTAVGTCEFAQLVVTIGEGVGGPLCPPESQVGTAHTNFATGFDFHEADSSVYRMETPFGAPARFAFTVLANVIVLDGEVRPPEYRVSVNSLNISTGLAVTAADLTFWGDPAAPSHTAERACPGKGFEELGGCASSAKPSAFLTMPTSCSEPGEGLPFSARGDSWETPGVFANAAFETHFAPGFPLAPESWGAPIGTEDCDIVPFTPSLSAQTTTDKAESASGFDLQLRVPDDGFTNPAGISQSHLKDAVVRLPEGMTINPSAAEGLGVCKPADLARESATSEFGAGCPAESKLGSVHLETPVISDPLDGSLFIAQQDDPGTATPGAENPFDSLIALYIVLKNRDRGLVVRLAGKVEPDPKSGQLVATFKDLPQLPFSEFDLHFREGARSPLISPPACGTYEVEANLTPWSDPSKVIKRTSEFQITDGPGEEPCPKAGVPPFHPGFEAGSINNSAGSYSPFYMRLLRGDGEQDMTRFSAVLPPGVLGKLAGVGKCPVSAIAIAKSKTGKQETASPSCPASSEIGHSLVGAGVGSVLTYVPGKVYLGGPFHGDPLSVIAITPVLAGPFDIGTVVVQEALTLNPKTAEVEVDGAASEPIPHILKGIPAKLRDLRVYVDRPDFIVNPTSCDPSSADATLFGGYLDVFSPADDVPVALSDRYQAASCASLGFKPKLALKLKGGTRRGGHPGLRAIYTPRKGDANVKSLVVRLPRSAFLDQAHIRTICTRVQFAADNCPKGAQYGYIKAWTPLIEEPLQGPVWLRSSNHKLPDLVFDLHGLVDVEVATRIDSAKGGIRATVESAPDAPLSKVDLRMQGGKKGLIINSRNLCGAISKANVDFTGHNGKQHKANPVMQADCGGGRKSKRRR